MKNNILHPAPGKLVFVNGAKMHIFLEGRGENTLVFLAGSGTVCPTLDFKPLWSILSDGYKIAVVERFGYGWSETTNHPRDIDTVLSESREALKLAGVKAPYILVAHSMSGLEAIYWAQKYPNEVKAIIGLDAAVPKAYENFKIPSAALIRVIAFFTIIGIHKPFAKALYKKTPLAELGHQNKPDAEVYIEMLKMRTLTPDMCNEGKYLRANADKVRNEAIPTSIPLLFFISNKNEKMIPGWGKILSDYAAHFKNGKSVLLDCGHYLHVYEPGKIAAGINEFVLSIV